MEYKFRDGITVQDYNNYINAPEFYYKKSNPPEVIEHPVQKARQNYDSNPIIIQKEK